MLKKLLGKTFSSFQLVCYMITLTVGATLLFVILSIGSDIRPLLQNESKELSNQLVVVSKKITIIKSLNKESIYFTKKEVNQLQEQPFVESISFFTSASFKVSASIPSTSNFPAFYTELFLESVPDDCLDIHPEQWKAFDKDHFVPIIIPESYVKLYNFGFAESQGLPVMSQEMISKFPFNLTVYGKGKQKTLEAKIVGFSQKINSILVPLRFMKSTNRVYGMRKENKPSRLLIHFKNVSSTEIIPFLKKNNYTFQSQEVKFGRWSMLIQIGLIAMVMIALIITLLSLFLILMSSKLVIQKNQLVIHNLYCIGVPISRIGNFYSLRISIISTISLLISLLLVLFIRGEYVDYLSRYFKLNMDNKTLILPYLILYLLILLGYHWVLNRKIRSLVATMNG
ncbi:hypothetical protein K4L44_13530 [Halosquirtibacter laminarini]|uniref:Uncharacterized protein n=1 Tax=Halosquirtibacter laminarini TaxID=3374600 RepID=A0AC61NQX9_9BACT|nr:hypothetical protein K4L44_13530 [Prolixibacteraceae bacterium]